MKISRQTAVVLIFLVLAIFTAVDVYAQFEGVARSFSQFRGSDLISNLTSIAFWAAGLGAYAFLYLAVKLLRDKWLSGDNKQAARILIGFFAYFIADYIVDVLGVRTAGVAFKEAVQIVWMVIIGATAINTFMSEEKGEKEHYGRKGLEFAVVWMIASTFIGPVNSLFVTGANLDVAIQTHALMGGAIGFGISYLGNRHEKKKEARKRAEEEAKKQEKEKEQVSAVDKMRQDMLKQMEAERKQLEDTRARANQVQPAVQTAAVPQAAYPIFVGLGQGLPTTYLPQMPIVNPIITAPEIYQADQEEIKNLNGLLTTLTSKYGETNPGKEIVYLAKLIENLEADLKSGAPTNWLNFVGERRDKAMHADEVEKFENVGTKEFAAKLRKLAVREGPTIDSIKATIKAARARTDYLLDMKNKLVKKVEKAITDRQQKSQTHVAAYTRKDEALRKLNDLADEMSDETQRFNSKLYDLHTLVAQAQQLKDPAQLKDAFEKFRNELFEAIKDLGALEDNAPKLSTIIGKDVKKRYDDVDKATVKYNKETSSEEIGRLLFGIFGKGKPPEGTMGLVSA